MKTAPRLTEAQRAELARDEERALGPDESAGERLRAMRRRMDALRRAR